MHSNMSTSRPRAYAMFCLLILGALVLLAACGSNSTNTGSPASTPTATTNTAPNTPTATSSGSGYGRYGNGGGNTTPTATTAPTGATKSATITTDSSGQFTFSPTSMTISVGTTIVWKNTTQTPHTVTSDDGKSFNSGDSAPIGPDATFSWKFTKTGTFAYHCDFHPYMKATIIVK